MLTPSANQYLRPEYLSPLPTTLDAKKSPLALLAQTCNNIGADTPNAKSLIPPLEKSSSNNSNNNSSNKESSLSCGKDSHREKSTPHQTEDKSSFKPYESIKKEEPSSDNEKGGFRTPTSKSCSPAISSTGSVNSGKNSPHSSGGANNNNNNNSSCSDSATKLSENTSTSVTSSISNPTVSTSLHSQHNRISIGCGSMFVEVNHHESALPKDHGLSAHLPLGYKSGQLIPGLPPSAGLLNSLSNCTGCTQIMGHGIPMDPSSMNSPYSQGMNSHGGSPLKPGSYPSSGSALSPYVAYARVKTITGGSTLVPICRDPYCTNCQLSMQNAQQLVGTTCPSGCTQCNHEKAVAAGLGAPHLSSLSLMPGLPGPNTPVSLNSGIYPHSMLTPRPYVCNWIAGDTYCGKRFSTSEELLQHLRTHTNLSASDSATLSLLSPSLSLSSAGLGACHLHYSMAPSLTSPAGLHRTYPTSLSPVSSLSASRYHPYKPPLSSLGGAPLSPFPPHPSLAASPYFSPYAMYGQRLGTAVHP